MKKNTMIIQVDTPQFDRDIERAATLLKKGENVAFPTETVYGLGGNAFDEQAILGIYEAKGRPSDNPLIVHISNKKMLEDLAIEIQPYVWHLIEAFWPGPLTVVLKKNQAVSSRVTGGLDTVAVRMPNHPVALKLIELAGVPVAAPSANLSGRPSPTKAAYVIEDLTGRIACIVAGEACEIGLESTVLDVTGENPVILRPGSVTQEQIESVVGSCEVDPALRDFSSEFAPKSPGMKYKHYAPEAQVTVYRGDGTQIIQMLETKCLDAISNGYRIGLMIFEADDLVLRNLSKDWPENWQAHVEICLEGNPSDLSEFARKLFGDMRYLDGKGCQSIYIHGVEETHLGRAIMNRLEKASEGRVFKI